MKIVKRKSHVLLENEMGSYHIGLKKFSELGEEEAKKFAEKEIEKKVKIGRYPFETINFEQARDLGFCEWGIEDFCKKLCLDIEKEYRIDDLNRSLTLGVFKKYPDECIKLFGENTFKYMGGLKEVLCPEIIHLVLRTEFFDEETLHQLSIDFARRCLPTFEKKHPGDSRPRAAIETKQRWINGDATDADLRAAWSAAESAARSARAAAWSAAMSARSAARSAQAVARTAVFAVMSARSAARFDAKAAAEYAAESAEKEKQVQIVLGRLEK